MERSDDTKRRRVVPKQLTDKSIDLTKQALTGDGLDPLDHAVGRVAGGGAQELLFQGSIAAAPTIGSRGRGCALCVWWFGWMGMGEWRKSVPGHKMRRAGPES